MKKINIKNLAHKILVIFVWVVSILVLIFVVITIIRIPYYLKARKTESQIIKIHSTKLKMTDVLGDNLPKDPGVESDKTIQGIDANNNGIRDDVELAIFKEYPNSAKTRAVLLQYALALQMMTTQPFINEEIATEITREQSRGFICVGEILQNKDSDESYNKLLSLISYIEDNQFNTKERKDFKNNFLKNVRSFSDLNEICDIDISKLLN